MTEINTREDLIASLRKTLLLRLSGVHNTKPGSKLSNRMGLEFLCGAAAAIDALGLDKTHGLTGYAFLVSVRDIRAFLQDAE